MLFFYENIDMIIKNLKTILLGYEVEFHTEKSRMSKSQYLYVNFPNRETYKFRISDHDYPDHLDEPPPDKPDSEELAGFYDFRSDEYVKAKKVLMDLLILHKTPKKGKKPDWVSKIQGLIQDYFGGGYRDVNISFCLSMIKKCNSLTIKNFYKYATFTELLKDGGVDKIPSIFQKLMKKHGIT